MSSTTRLTLTGQIIDIRRMRTPRHGGSDNFDNSAAGPAGQFLYEDVKQVVPGYIKYVILINDFYTEDGPESVGSILTGNIMAALNFAQGIVDGAPTGQDAFSIGDGDNSNPFEVVIGSKGVAGFSIPSADVNYIMAPVGAEIYGGSSYAIYITRGGGSDVIRDFINGTNPYNNNGLDTYINIQVFYKMYINADEEVAWCRKPIDLPHPIGVQVGNIYGQAIGAIDTDPNNLGPNTNNADGTTFGTGNSLQAAVFQFLKPGMVRSSIPFQGEGYGVTNETKKIYAALYVPKKARTNDNFAASARKLPTDTSGETGYVMNKDTSRFAWNTLSFGGSNIQGYHDAFTGPFAVDIFEGSTASPVGTLYSTVPSANIDDSDPLQNLFFSGYNWGVEDADGSGFAIPVAGAPAVAVDEYFNPAGWWKRSAEKVLVFNTPSEYGMLAYKYGTHSQEGGVAANPNAGKLDPFNSDNYVETMGFQAIYYSYQDNQVTDPVGDPEVLGCTHVAACNYNPEANVDDLSCTFPEFYIYESDTNQSFNIQGSSGSSMLVETTFSIAFGDNAELDPYEGTNNPFYNGSTATSLMVYIEVVSGGDVSNFNLRIFQTGPNAFQAYNPVSQEVLPNVTITVNDGSFEEASTGGELTIGIVDLAFPVEEDGITQINIVAVEIASASWAEVNTLCSVQNNFYVEVTSTDITGCTDNTALNYNPDANITDNSLCVYCNNANGLGSSFISVAHSNNVALTPNEYADLQLAAGDLIPDGYNVTLYLTLNQPAASMIDTQNFGIVVFDPATVTNGAQADAAFTEYIGDIISADPYNANVIFTNTITALNTSANDNVQTFSLDHPWTVNTTSHNGYFFYVYPISDSARSSGLMLANFALGGCVTNGSFVLQEGVCNDCGIGITNCVEVLDPITQFANNDLCTTSTNCDDFATNGSVNFIGTELYTSPEGETVNCSGYFDIQVSGTPGMIFSVSVSTNTGQIFDHYLTGMSGTNFSIIPDTGDVLGSTGMTFTLEEIAAITGSPYAFGEYTFNFTFYISLNTFNDTFDNLIPLIGSADATECPLTYTYNLTENDVEICGCMIQTAENYNPQATFNIYGECGEIPGCIDPTAINFNENANVDNGSCQYPEFVCTDPDAINYVSEVNPPYILADNTLCQYIVIFGCTDPEASNYNPLASIDNGTCLVDGEPEGPVVPPEIPDFEAFLVYLQHCLQYKGEKYFSAMLTGKTVDEDRYLHLSMINDLLRKKAAACLFDGEDASNARLREFIKIVLTYCEDCRERSGILKSPYGAFQDVTYMPGTTTYTGTPILNLGGPGGISLGGGESLDVSD